MSLENKIMGITTDNASNNLTFMSSLSLWAAKKLKELIVKIHAFSLRREKLNVHIRWNSTFDMIKRALKLRIALEFVTINNKDLKKYKQQTVFYFVETVLETLIEMALGTLGVGILKWFKEMKHLSGTGF
ncbi:hypothetical protein C1645_826714 [Glomus cerebriforme]|uniref:Uncharacterized protein n=1 Tax=Glomus cerebriforme TaxID=658196 RepID=A0A397SUG2_9GLOM|nr:hypothetical protein C1645_826714 [Glomus cerebriforme]